MIRRPNNAERIGNRYLGRVRESIGNASSHEEDQRDDKDTRVFR